MDSEALARGDLEDACRSLPADTDGVIVLVGHEPHLSSFLGRLLGAPSSEGMSFAKGGAALVEVPGRLEEGGRLVWFLPPKALKRIRD